ncbi:MAG: hypothetical protein ABIP06_10390 [Pyrinomonadaceae bacterium]
MKILFTCLTFLTFAQLFHLTAQEKPNRYETEYLTNPNPGKKDTREVNAVLVFEKDSLKIYSRRKKDELFKEFKYSDIEFLEHSFSKQPFIEFSKKTFLVALRIGMPINLDQKERHWLTIGGNDDFVVLKIENDNYRLIKMEFFIRNLNLENVNENNL